jgi:thiol-disulfide isomerase/thioredoxin
MDIQTPSTSIITGGKKRHTRKNHSKKHTIVAGKIFADWCGHCVALKPEWEKLKRNMKHQMGRSIKNIQIVFEEIGETEKNKKQGKTVDGMIAKFNEKYMSNSPQKLALDGGYPTIFMYCPKTGMLKYYQGARTSDELWKWYKSECDSLTNSKNRSLEKMIKIGKTRKNMETHAPTPKPFWIW